MIVLQCKLDIKFKLKSIVGVRDFLKGNLRARYGKIFENHCSKHLRCNFVESICHCLLQLISVRVSLLCRFSFMKLHKELSHAVRPSQDFHSS